jgi:translocation and assembly module TamB
MRRSILALAFVTLAVLALPPAAVYYAAFTQGGLELVARLMPHRFGHLRLTIVGVSGTATGGIHVDRLEIDDPHVYLRLEGVDGRITLAPLLLQTLHVPHASFRKVLIEVKPYPEQQARSRWHFLPHWLEIRADDVRIDSGTLIVPDGHRFDATKLEGSGLVRPRIVRVDRAGMTIGAMRLTGHGLLRSGDPFGMDVATLTTIRVPGQPVWVIDASGKGTVDSLALHVRFAAPLQADFVGRAADLTRDWHWQGAANVESFDLSPWHGNGTTLGCVTGRLALEGNSGGFTAQGPLTPSSLQAGALDTLFRGAYSRRVFKVTQLEIRHAASGLDLNAHGEIGIVAHGPFLELRGTWRNFRWPLTGPSADVRSRAGQYFIEGTWPYALRGSGELTLAALQPIGFDVAGTLGKQQLLVTKASLRAFGGTADLTRGTAIWSPRPSWSAAGTAANVDPSSVRPDLPGRLTFGFEAAGSRFDSDTDFSLSVHDLTGKLDGLRAQADGQVSRHGAVWQLSGVKAQLGTTALALDGAIDRQIDLRFDLAAQDLALIEPQLAGRLLASGTLIGPRTSPAIDVVASGTGIRYRGLSLASLNARIDFDPRRSGPSLVRLQAHDFAYGRHKLDIAFTLNGAAAQQNATLTLSGAAYKLRSRAAGALAGGTWTGRIETMSFAGDGAHLALEAPSAVTVSTDAVRVRELCLLGKPTRACGEVDWTPGRWSVSALAGGLPLAMLTAGLSPNVHYRGVVGVTARASAGRAAPAQGELDVTLAGAEMLRQTPDGRLETTKLGSGTLAMNATAERVEGRLSLDAGAAGSIKGRIVAQRTAAAWRSSPLTGTLTARTSLQAWEPLYAGQVDRASGEASAILTVGGTLGTPHLSGMLKVLDGAFDLYQYNLEVRDASLQARLLDDGIDVNGAARIGAGTASASGQLVWRRGAPFGHLELKGTSLRAVDLPEAVIDASPDLNFAIAGRSVNVTGTVEIPQAHIAPAELTNAVRVSSDQILVGEENPGPTSQLKVASTIRIELGDGVHIETQGLTGRLTGNVVVTSGEEAITRATGELRIADGKYAAYGRTLDIAQGRMIYTGSPLDDPGIDIRAEKNFQDPEVGAAVAGINVRGTLRQPQITFFSEPPLPQQQIISLVFAGGTLFGGPQLGAAASTQTSRSENAQLLGQGAAVLGSQIGLPVGIEPTYNNDTALVLGKYLSPKLYVSYGITLIQSLNMVKLRYTLGDHWSLSTEFGQLGGADLVYTFQK